MIRENESIGNMLSFFLTICPCIRLGRKCSPNNNAGWSLRTIHDIGIHLMFRQGDRRSSDTIFHTHTHTHELTHKPRAHTHTSFLLFSIASCIRAISRWTEFECSTYIVCGVFFADAINSTHRKKISHWILEHWRTTFRVYIARSSLPKHTFTANENNFRLRCAEIFTFTFYGAKCPSQ